MDVRPEMMVRLIAVFLGLAVFLMIIKENICCLLQCVLMVLLNIRINGDIFLLLVQLGISQRKVL